MLRIFIPYFASCNLSFPIFYFSHRKLMEVITSASVSKTNSFNPSTRNEETSTFSSEESGWTSYFEDFLASKDNKGGVAIDPTTVSLSSSLISDASCSRCVSINTNKRKERGALCNYQDDFLEDTACSPLSITINNEVI